MARKFCEEANIVPAFIPVNLATAGGVGDWVSLKNYGRVVYVFCGAVGTAGEDPTITAQQATAVAGTDAKALTFTTIWRKQAATNLLAVGTFTETTQTAAQTYTNITAAEQVLVWVVEFSAEDLDTSGGFDCVQVTVDDDITNVQLGVGFYILLDPRYPQATVESAIAD